MSNPPVLNATLVKRTEITSDLYILRIKPDEPIHPFLSGQYVALGLFGSHPRPAHFPAETELHPHEKLIKRAYSIGSSPDEKEYLEFYIAVVPEGALTSRLATLREGDRLYAAPKISGTFTLHDVPADHNLVLVSTGTGLAPYISMLRTPSTWTPGRIITVVHGVRYQQDLAYADELREFGARMPSFRYIPMVSRVAEDVQVGNGSGHRGHSGAPVWTGEKGRVPRLFEDGTIPLAPQADHVFLCGNPAMIDDMEKLLLERGFTVHSKKTPGNIHLEKYW